MDGSPTGDILLQDAQGRFHDNQGRFVNGHSEYRARLQRLAERERQLTLDYDPSPSERQLLPIIARYLDDAERARTVERRVRAANAARRLLKDIPRKPAPVQLVTARELLDRLRS
jgi:hypothetical protein